MHPFSDVSQSFFLSILPCFSTLLHHYSFSLCYSFSSFLSVTLYVTFLWSQFQGIIVAVFIFPNWKMIQRHQRLDSQLELASNRLAFVWLLPLVRRVWKLQELKKEHFPPSKISVHALLPGDLFKISNLFPLSPFYFLVLSPFSIPFSPSFASFFFLLSDYVNILSWIGVQWMWSYDTEIHQQREGWDLA